MTFRLFGAILVIVGCGGFGFLIASAHRKEVKTLKEFIVALEYISAELQYRLTPLPELCRQTSAVCHGDVRNFFHELAFELNQQISPNVSKCTDAVLSRNTGIPGMTKGAMKKLGSSLGRFDIDGQLRDIDLLRCEMQCSLENYAADQDSRLRNYQTLGLCAGAAIAILFI